MQHTANEKYAAFFVHFISSLIHGRKQQNKEKRSIKQSTYH